MSQLNRVFQKLQNEPSRASQVERIIFLFRLGSTFDLANFINRFSNLHAIYMEKSINTQFQTMTTPFNNKKKIECIFDQFGSTMALNFLESKNCSQLKCLAIGSGIGSPNFFRILIDLPSALPLLTHLSLFYIDATFDKLVLLYKILPLLEVLEFQSITIYESELPTTIEPAKSVVHGSLFMIATDLEYTNKILSVY